MPTSLGPMSAPRVALSHSVLDIVGVEIVSGQVPAGSAFTLQDIIERFEVSRTVARETMRALEELSLVAARPRIGITVLPAERWNVFSPRVIEWRLQSGQQDAQLRSLTELRFAVEPAAARLAATRATDAQRARIVELAAALGRLGEAGAGHEEEFLAADIEYHALLLHASGNEMFAALTGTIGEVLVGRTRLGLQPAFPEAEALARHHSLARAIADGDPEAAEAHANALGHEVRDALSNR